MKYSVHVRWCYAASFGLMMALLIGCVSVGTNKLRSLRDQDVAQIATLDSRKVALGNMLFFDNRLSRNNSLSCASCHNPDLGFGDGLALSTGVAGNTLKRHTPPLYNLAWNTHFFWDGRVSSLEEQVFVVIASPEEMGMPLDSLVEGLAQVPFYKEQFETLYPQSGLTARTIANALATFERSLVSFDAPFDGYMQGDATALSPEALRGMQLFTGKARCIKCHNGPNFTNGDFHNTGVLGDDMGRQALDRIAVKREFQMTPYPFFATLRAFKTPSLRNVALTAPYMHNGSEATLEDVVRFYNQGGKAADTRGRARHITELHLSEQDIADLVAFLEALTSPVEVERLVVPEAYQATKTTP